MYAQADLRLCWSHIPHCWISHVLAHLSIEHWTRCDVDVDVTRNIIKIYDEVTEDIFDIGNVRILKK